MTSLNLQEPLRFRPIFHERIWGGRQLESLFQKKLPTGLRIGESWELVDRPEAQSQVENGPLEGMALHDLWMKYRREVFGSIADAERFPLLIKLLDARERLSLQVHPPPDIAAELEGESKTEFWYFAATEPDAEILVGLKEGSSRAQIEKALARGTVEEHVHKISVRAGDAMFLPSGRMHAIGAGNVIIEIQENSDTTYRVFDWNRLDESGAPRQLHIDESMRAIDFQDHEPELTRADGESLVRHELFSVEKWNLETVREAAAIGSFAIIACLSGKIESAGLLFGPGDFFLVPASLPKRALQPRQEKTSLLRITIPS